MSNISQAKTESEFRCRVDFCFPSCWTSSTCDVTLGQFWFARDGLATVRSAFHGTNLDERFASHLKVIQNWLPTNSCTPHHFGFLCPGWLWTWHNPTFFLRFYWITMAYVIIIYIHIISYIISYQSYHVLDLKLSRNSGKSQGEPMKITTAQRAQRTGQFLGSTHCEPQVGRE